MHDAYTKSFFSSQQEGSLESAQVIVPIVLSLFNVASVIDVGCGTGSWLSVFNRLGVRDILGIDGDYVPRNMLEIPADRFIPHNLECPLRGQSCFDLACSLEVAEHLPRRCAEQFVGDLVALSQVVLFSAAIPGQGGTNHFNEQWPSYWAELFWHHGYVAVDCIRPRIFGNPRVKPWYSQNVVVFCDPLCCPKNQVPVSNAYFLDRVDPTFFLMRIHNIVSGYEARLQAERAWYAEEIQKLQPTHTDSG